ncbi:methyl-accepting chemotaxis protein [Pseudobacillus sp. FSL P4-0506]|uniref:methyl-accepting chemotaxis protein n=1 Tax=unclassified Pseudobacillus TaxID=2619284 RepID=UPI0030FC12D0
MNFTIGKKLMIGFLSVAILLGIISFVSYYNIKQIDDSYTDLVDRRSAILSNAKDIKMSAAQEIAGLRGVLLQEEGAAEFLSESIINLNKKINITSNLIKREEDKDLLNELTNMNEEFESKSSDIVTLMKTNKAEAQRFANEEVIPLAIEIENTADALQQGQAKLMEEGSKTNTELVNTSVRTVLILSITALVLAIIIGTIITRIITNPILSLAKGAESIASGDLTQEDIQVKYKDEIGQLANSFNQMKMNLRELIHQVNSNIKQVAATSEELSASAEETSRATEQISGAIQEVASSSEKQVSSAVESAQAIDEISRGMDQAASSIQSMKNLTAAANEKASIGNTVVIQTVDQMNLVQDSTTKSSTVVNALGEKSREIGQIVELITQVATQTNLLALNAAIEAARAGENGKGFAVVADEVRKLAEESAHAAGQIRDLIQEIQTEADKAVRSINDSTTIVQDGIKMVDQTGEAFRDIVQSIEQMAAESQGVSVIVEQVNSSSQNMVGMAKNISNVVEQSTGNIQSIAASAEEQNAAMEEVSSSAEVLSEMARELKEVISRFKA